MVKRTSRTVASAVMVVACIPLVVGCNDLYKYGSFTLGTDGSHLKIASCEDRVIDRVIFEEHRPGDEKWTRVWEASGLVELPSGEWVVVADGSSSGLDSEIFIEPNPSPGTRYFLVIKGETASGTTAMFTIPEDGLPDGKWLTPRHELVDEPCPDGQ